VMCPVGKVLLRHISTNAIPGNSGHDGADGAGMIHRPCVSLAGVSNLRAAPVVLPVA